MKRELILLPRAETDLNIHFIYFGENAGVEIALRFNNSTKESFYRLCETPLIGVSRDFLNQELPNLRMWFVKGFEDYLIFYRVLDESVQIVRVLHSSQDTENIISVESDDPANLIS
jgi:toxin ParE1/3/4